MAWWTTYTEIAINDPETASQYKIVVKGMFILGGSLKFFPVIYNIYAYFLT